MGEYRRIEYNGLFKLAQAAFEKIGYCAEDAKTITDVLLMSDLMGIESHGVQRLSMYMTGMDIGRINKNAQIKVVKETPLSAVLDGDDGMGQIVGKMAMEMAIKKAKTSGMGVVLVRNSAHYGIAGYYSDMAAAQGLLGMSLTNTEALVVPTFGRTPMMGTNPIAVSMPANPTIFHLDMATSVVPAGKLEVYDKIQKPTPEGWIVSEQGATTTDAHEFIMIRKNKTDGGLLPLGGYGELHSGHKGYGMSLLVELMTGIMAGGFSSPMVRKDPKVEKCCHMFAALDYGMFDEREAVEKRFSQYLQDIRDSHKADGQDRIYIHGEKEFESKDRVLKEGVLMSNATYDEVTGICTKLGIDYSSLLKEVQ